MHVRRQINNIYHLTTQHKLLSTLKTLLAMSLFLLVNKELENVGRKIGRDDSSYESQLLIVSACTRIFPELR